MGHFPGKTGYLFISLLKKTGSDRICHTRTYMAPMVIMALFMASFLVAGCVSEPGRVIQNETPAASQPPGTSPVPPAPHQFFMKTGQREQFTFRDHTITINYTSAYPMQIVKITVDESEKVIQKALTESPKGIDWKEGELRFTLKPVVWEIREGQNVPIYESTWNTNEVYVEVGVV